MHTVRQIAIRAETTTLRAYRRGRILWRPVTADRGLSRGRYAPRRGPEFPLLAVLPCAVVAVLEGQEFVDRLDQPRVGTR